MTAISPNFIIQCQLRFESTSNSIFKRAIGISTNSTEEVGRIYLDALKQHAPEFRPTAYLGDAAEAFANAALGVFYTITTRLMCFAHVFKVGEVLEYTIRFSFFIFHFSVQNFFMYRNINLNFQNFRALRRLQKEYLM